MNTSLTFEFEGDPLRVETSNTGETIFNGKDACRLLSLSLDGSPLRRLDEDEKVLRTTQTLGGEQMAVWLREAGLYRLIFESRKPEAEAFKRWVFHEVLPQIRRTGSYGKPPGLDLAELAVLARTCDAVRRTHGRAAAQRIWADLGGPELPGIEAVGSRSSSDHQSERVPIVREFVNECCEEDPSSRVQAQELYDTYRRWAEASASNVILSITAFGMTMNAMGYPKILGAKRYYQGLRLNALVRRQMGI